MPKTKDPFRTDNVNYPDYVKSQQDASTVIRKGSKWDKAYLRRKGEVMDYYAKNPTQYSKKQTDKSAAGKVAARDVGEYVKQTALNDRRRK